MSASFEFYFDQSDDKRYGEHRTVAVRADDFLDAMARAKSLLGPLAEGADLQLNRVVDIELMTHVTDVRERHILVEEKQLDVHHSGQITERRISVPDVAA